MSIVTITLNNKNFQLSCDEGAEEQLKSLASSLNARMVEIKRANSGASFELLLVMAALSIQDQLESVNAKFAHVEGGKSSNEGEQFAETLSTIAQYLENLAKKIDK
jgi:cell division protein ZapA (FtsZ GTPase activity inhibitor)